MKAREINRRIESLGGVQVSQKGSHRKYQIKMEGGTVSTIVPQHSGDVPIGTARSIERALEPVFGKGWLR